MSKNEKEIVSHLPQDNNFTEKVFEIFNKLNVLSFFSIIIFALDFFMKIGFHYYHVTYLSIFDLPELFPIENYHDDPHKVWLLWLLVIIILGYIFLTYLAMYLFYKNRNNFKKMCFFYFIVQVAFITFAFIFATNYVQRIMLILLMILCAVFVAFCEHFFQKNTKKNELKKRIDQSNFTKLLTYGVAALLFINSVIFFNLYIISIRLGGMVGANSGNSTKKTILEGEYKNKPHQSVKLYEEVDLIYFEKCIEKDCFGFTVNDDGKIILKEFDRSEIDHSYSRKN